MMFNKDKMRSTEIKKQQLRTNFLINSLNIVLHTTKHTRSRLISLPHHSNILPTSPQHHQVLCTLGAAQTIEIVERVERSLTNSPNRKQEQRLCFQRSQRGHKLEECRKNVLRGANRARFNPFESKYKGQLTRNASSSHQSHEEEEKEYTSKEIESKKTIPHHQIGASAIIEPYQHRQRYYSQYIPPKYAQSQQYISLSQSKQPRHNSKCRNSSEAVLMQQDGVKVILSNPALSHPSLQKTRKILPPIKLSMSYDQSLSGEGIQLQVHRGKKNYQQKECSECEMQVDCGKVFSNLLPQQIVLPKKKKKSQRERERVYLQAVREEPRVSPWLIKKQTQNEFRE